MNLSSIPKNSTLHHWLTLGKFTEIPFSYLTAVFLSGLSCLLRRNAWVTFGRTVTVYPNLSIVLIGPTGIGKDQVIDMGTEYILEKFMPEHEVTGVTKEAIASSLLDIHNRFGEPATSGYLLAHEMKDFFGGKDFQQGMIELLTNILSNKSRYRYAVKHDPFTIPQPTITLQAGSTPEWFHQLPKGALEGGFIPRSLVVVEFEPRGMIAIPQDLMDYDDTQAEREAHKALWDALGEVVEVFRTPREIRMTADAKDHYWNWYTNRMKMFGEFAKGYAHRSRQHLARIAMLSAIARQSLVIDVEDLVFAVDFMNYIIQKIETALLAPTEEGQCVMGIKGLLPTTLRDAIIALRSRFKSRVVTDSWTMMVTTREIVKKGELWHAALDKVAKQEYN